MIDLQCVEQRAALAASWVLGLGWAGAFVTLYHLVTALKQFEFLRVFLCADLNLKALIFPVLS